ncbi:hypothetical protein RGUI_1643 [Rhodovulum sp. P5]|uniref:hypothetical protein n=1 Tax=Rhodovulum sp. P5 TaxID=1564506 RepID=UPI0009C1BA70|nr:hypothetical protein [Rhodovulum sp. P5]ARE39784.1 hypothetical protein RGUI_1643 [Rhodovulum sp. P5]
MRSGLTLLAVFALAACNTQLSDSAAGVGYDSYGAYAVQREQALSGEGADPVTVAPLDVTGTAAVIENPLDATTPVDPSDVAITTNNPGLSDEQNFAAVSSRVTIQDDRARLQAQRENYVVVEPKPLPARSGATGPNIVEYALATTNRVGESRYRRLNPFGASQVERKCGRYASADKAQEAFLKAGGPERDRLGLDPDGDGFACFWDPAPFRSVLR